MLCYLRSIFKSIITILPAALLSIAPIFVSAQFSEEFTNFLTEFEKNLESLPLVYSTPEQYTAYSLNDSLKNDEIELILNTIAPGFTDRLIPEVKALIDIYHQHPHETGLMINTFAQFQPFLNQELKAKFLPDWFLFLPPGLTCLNPNSQILKDGAGIWQLRRATALSLGLTVNQNIDERYDWKRATEAALTSIQILYQNESTEIMTLSGYLNFPIIINNGLNSKSHLQGGINFNSVDQLTEIIISATAAAKYILSVEQSGASTIRYTTYRLDTLLVPYFKLNYFKESNSFSDILSKYNYHIRKIEKSDDENMVKVYIPEDQLAYFSDLSKTIDKNKLDSEKVVKTTNDKVFSTNSDEYLKYKVRKGDMLGSISRKYGVSIRQLKSLNNLKNDFIREGQILRIPLKK